MQKAAWLLCHAANFVATIPFEFGCFSDYRVLEPEPLEPLELPELPELPEELPEVPEPLDPPELLGSELEPELEPELELLGSELLLDPELLLPGLLDAPELSSDWYPELVSDSLPPIAELPLTPKCE